MTDTVKSLRKEVEALRHDLERCMRRETAAQNACGCCGVSQLRHDSTITARDHENRIARLECWARGYG